MADKAQAKAAVVNISKKFGFVGDDIMSQVEAWNPEIRRILEEGMLAKDKLAAHSIKTLARNIYGSDARFVFELLQNADDNRFTRARAAGALPHISFQIHPNRIIVECNEDGFTVNDLSAICSVGESTKSESYGYIGAKGIGFKSVFIAAWKVYIQSGSFSYYFKHRKDDSGLGMVLPIWVDTDEELSTPLTRMTLHLHEEGDASELQHLRNTIFKQLNDLQETCLLFLRNLKRIYVSFYNEDGERKSFKEFRVGETDTHRVFLETTSTDRDGKITVEKKQYHVTRYMASNLSASNNRETAKTESSTAEVVLAFPLTDEFEPLLDKQQLFAFLPVTMSDFKFIIQSDFDTSANRQDIVTTSRRNIGLLDAIAAAFIKAVLQFCEHEDLCYTWPDFLPSPDAEYSSDFWAGLAPKIKTVLSETPVLRSRHRSYLRLIRDVSIVGGDARDSNGNPLLDDTNRDLYISKLYSYRRTEALKKYGLEIGYVWQILDALEVDLKTPTSRMKSESTDADWHSRVAKLFSSCFHKEWNNSTKRLKRLPLLPLRSGEWVSASSGAVYLPTANGIPVPPGLGIRVLDPKAVANQDRKNLLVLLGASEPTVASVRSFIHLAHSGSSASSISLAASKAHLHFLYLTHDPKQRTENIVKGIKMFGSDNIFADPHLRDFYLPSQHAYGPEALLKKTSDAPGFSITFVSPDYLKDIPDAPTSRPTWTKWLQDMLGVRQRLRLVSARGDTLSDVWHYVREHRPEKLLGLLEYLWQYEGSRIASSDSLIKEIKKTSAAELCAGEWSCTLDDTWLPLPHLQSQCSRFMEEHEIFPFLTLEDSVSMTPEQLTARWAFLHTHFSVGKDEDTAFFLEILRLIQCNEGDDGIINPKRILDLYIAIDAKCTGAVDRQAERKMIRDFFYDYSIVFLPRPSSRDAEWWGPPDLLWEAPPDMQTMASLKHSYSQFLGADPDQMRLLSHFFEQTLSVEKINWRHITEELKHLAKLPSSDRQELWDVDRIRGLYEYLSNINIIAFSDDLRKEFEQESLIFTIKNGQPSWHKTGDCLWSSTAEIQGKATLNDHYEDLKGFFINALGVQTLTLQMVYDDLVQTHQQQPRTVGDIKQTIWSFNSLLQTEPDMRRQLDPKPLLEACIFPVRYPGDGGKRLLSAVDSEFAIVDRDYLAVRFEGKIKFFDYNLAEVRRLKPFLEWSNLEQRYLSRSVKEITSVSSGQTGRNISVPNRDVKRKAHALLRVTATFNSPRYESDPEGLYQLLRTAQVIETNGISCLLSLSQNGHAVQVEEPVGEDMHISEEDDELTIYVPRNKKSQEFCFGSLLPARLADWLMRDPTSQILGGNTIDGKVDNALITVLTTLLAVDVSVLSRSLDHHGIIQVPIANEDITDDGIDLEENDDEDVEEEVQDEVEDEVAQEEFDYFENDAFNDDDLSALVDPSTPGTSTPTTTHQSSPPSEQIHVSVISRQSRLTAATARHRPAMPISSHSVPSVISQSNPLSIEDHHYRALIRRVITAARSDTARFPSVGPFDMSTLLDNIPATSSTATEVSSYDGIDTTTSRFRSTSQLERDKKIGAAGELYVFELLSKLSLQGFSRQNWQSTIRGYITSMHEDYMDLRAWQGRETADFTYDDVHGDLWRLLRDKGYLGPDFAGTSEEVNTKYFIEVKTTTGPCDAPFYMSKGQYRRMRDIHNGHLREVYMVLRVFGIESSCPGMRVYVDPEHLRVNGGLVFTGETWSVVPGPSS